MINIYHGGCSNKRQWQSTCLNLYSLNYWSASGYIPEPNTFLLSGQPYILNCTCLKGVYRLYSCGVHVAQSQNGSSQMFNYKLELAYYQLNPDGIPGIDGLDYIITPQMTTQFAQISLNLRANQANPVYSLVSFWDDSNIIIGENYKPGLIFVKVSDFVRPEDIWVVNINVFFTLEKIHI